MIVETLIFILIQGLLIWAALMDIYYREVYDFIWLFITILGTVLIFMLDAWSVDLVISLLIFFIIQEVFMRHVYGLADCHALCSLSVVLSCLKKGLIWYTYVLLVAFILLVLVQMVKRNVGKDLKLKSKVPMIPYITVGFWAIFGICVP